jgi:hypothetical protein
VYREALALREVTYGGMGAPAQSELQIIIPALNNSKLKRLLSVTFHSPSGLGRKTVIRYSNLSVRAILPSYFIPQTKNFLITESSDLS